MSETPPPAPASLPPPLPLEEPIPGQVPMQALPISQTDAGFDGPYLHAPYGKWTSAQPHRPGIITTIGIISVVVGALGIMGGGLSAMYGGIFYMVAQTTSAMTFVPTAPPTPVTDHVLQTTDEPVATGERGSELPQRQIIIDALATLRPFDDARRKQLDALFAQSGQDVFPANPAGLTSADVLRAVNESGELPGANSSIPGRESTVAGPDYFVIATGRIEVSDDRAVFEPKDRSQESVRVTRKLAPAANGVADSKTNTDEIIPIGAPSTAPAPMPMAIPVGPAGARGKISGTVATIVVVEGALSVLLSIYLLVIGILVLRQHPRGRWLHQIYALLKIPLAVVCGVAWWWFVGEFILAMSSPGTATSGTNPARAIVLFAVSGLALLYPIGLLITLSVPAVRKYYDSGISQV